jgi:hypothetical protein
MRLSPSKPNVTLPLTLGESGQVVAEENGHCPRIDQESDHGERLREGCTKDNP